MDEDEAVRRMRAADPAAGSEPEAERLAGLTAARRGDELAARRERRRPWVAVAAVTAGALAVGGVGYGLGRSADGPPLQADQAVSESPALAIAPEGMADARAMAATDMAIAPGYGGSRTTFTALGLSDAAGSAAAWAFDGAGTVTEEAAARAAQALGVSGEPREEAGWVVGPNDGSGPTLHLMPDGPATVMFHDPTLYELDQLVEPMPLPAPLDEDDPGLTSLPEIDPDVGREEGGAGSSGSAGGADPREPAPAPPQEPGAGGEPALEDPASDGEPATDGEPAPEPTAAGPDAPAAQGAAALLGETLTALGLDPDAAEYETQEHWAGEEAVSVVAHQLLEGRRTGVTWSADVVDEQVLSFTGPLAPLVALGEYDVLSPADAVDRLGDPRFGGTPVWRGDVVAGPILPYVPERGWGEPPEPPPAAGAAIEWPVTDVTIVSAEPVLTQHHTRDGSVLLLPGYELSDAQGQTWSVLAVADHELAF